MAKTKSKQKIKAKPRNNVQPKSNVSAAQIANLENRIATLTKQIRAPQPRKTNWVQDLGTSAGNIASKIFGMGAYAISQNSLYDAKTGSQVPFMHSTSETITFRHREYIREISSSVAFSGSTLAVNPGLSGTFPYLSNIAASFQEYKFKGLVFEFKSTSAVPISTSTNLSQGVVMLSAQYRADAAPLSTKVDFLNNMWSVDTKVSDSVILPIECDPKENPLSIQYVRNGPVTGDAKLYDLCTLNIATTGSQSASVVGELWASYEVELYKPQVISGLNPTAASHFVRNGPTASFPFGANATSTIVDGLTLTVTGTTISIPAGSGTRFVVQIWSGVGAAVAFTSPAFSITNGSFSQSYNSQSQLNGIVPVNGTTTTSVSYNFIVTVTDTNIATVITASTAGTVPTGANVDVFVVAAPDYII